MKHLTFLLATILSLTGNLAAQQLPSAPTPQPSPADDNAWNRLSWITPGTQVSVSRAHHLPFRCSDLHVTDQGLSCEFHSIWTSSLDLDLPRAEVRSVSIRHDKRNFWIGVAAMSTVGFVVGASQSNIGPYNYRAENGLIGAALVGFATSPLVIAVVPLLPGHTVYRAGSLPPTPKAPKPLRKAHAFLARHRSSTVTDSPQP
jgi:hypothetical protein